MCCSMMLSGEGYEIIEACNAGEAVEQAEKADLDDSGCDDAGRVR